MEHDHQNPLHAEMCLQIGSDGKKEKKKGQREGQEEKEGSGREGKLGAKTFVEVPLAEGGDSNSLHFQDAYNVQSTSTKINGLKHETVRFLQATVVGVCSLEYS